MVRMLKGSKKGDSNGKSKKEKLVQRQMLQVWQDKSHVKFCRSKATSAFEVGDKLSETGCIEMASVDLNGSEKGAVQLPKKDHTIRIGIDSCAVVNVFHKSVADDYPMLDTPAKTKSYRPASGKLLPDLGVREKSKTSSETGLSDN